MRPIKAGSAAVIKTARSELALLQAERLDRLREQPSDELSERRHESSGGSALRQTAENGAHDIAEKRNSKVQQPMEGSGPLPTCPRSQAQPDPSSSAGSRVPTAAKQEARQAPSEPGCNTFSTDAGAGSSNGKHARSSNSEQAGVGPHVRGEDGQLAEGACAGSGSGPVNANGRLVKEPSWGSGSSGSAGSGPAGGDDDGDRDGDPDGDGYGDNDSCGLLDDDLNDLSAWDADMRAELWCCEMNQRRSEEVQGCLRAAAALPLAALRELDSGDEDQGPEPHAQQQITQPSSPFAAEQQRRRGTAWLWNGTVRVSAPREAHRMGVFERELLLSGCFDLVGQLTKTLWRGEGLLTPEGFAALGGKPYTWDVGGGAPKGGEEGPRLEGIAGEVGAGRGSGPALAGLLRAHWPQLLLDEAEGGHAGAAAWRRLAETAAREESGLLREVLYRALRGLLALQRCGVALFRALEPRWCRGHAGLHPADVAAFSVVFTALESTSPPPPQRAEEDGPPPFPIPPPVVLYWALAKVPPECMLLLLEWPVPRPQAARKDQPNQPPGPPPPPQQQRTAAPAPLSLAHMQLVVRAVAEQPLGVMAVVMAAMAWAVGSVGGRWPGSAAQELERRALIMATAVELFAADKEAEKARPKKRKPREEYQPAKAQQQWQQGRGREGRDVGEDGEEEGREAGDEEEGKGEAEDGEHGEERAGRRKDRDALDRAEAELAREQRQDRQLLHQQLQAGARQQSQAGVATPEQQQDQLLGGPAGAPWAGPEALRRLQLAVRALDEYGWLEEPYGCTAAGTAYGKGGVGGMLQEAVAALREELAAGKEEAKGRVRKSRTEAAGMVTGSSVQLAEGDMEAGCDPGLAAFREARSAALCVRGAPLSGCQLRGVVEALRPGLLAAHPGTWGAAVRRAEQAERTAGQQPDAKLTVLLRAAVSCLASLKYDSLPLAALQLAPCAIAGLLAAVQPTASTSSGSSVTHKQHHLLLQRTHTDLLLLAFTTIPYELCSTAVQLLAAYAGNPALSGPPAGPLDIPCSPGRTPAQPYDTYLRLALYDMACTATAVHVSTGLSKEQDLQQQCSSRHVTPAISDRIKQLAAALVSACPSRTTTTSSTEPSSSFNPLPDDNGTAAAGDIQSPAATWQELERAQVAAAHRDALIHALGVPATGLLGIRPGRAGAMQPLVSNGAVHTHLLLDSVGMGSGWAPEVAGDVMSCLLLPRVHVRGGDGVARAVVGGPEAATLLLLSLHHEMEGLEDLVVQPQLLLPCSGQKDPLQSLPGVDEHPHQQQPHQQLQLQPPGSACAASVEAAAAGALLRLDVRHGASLKKSMPEAKQYPSWDALNRSSLAVTASCSWSSLLAALRGPFFSRQRTGLTWITGEGVVGILRALLLGARLRQEMLAAGRDIVMSVTAVQYDKVDELVAQEEQRQRQLLQQRQQDEEAREKQQLLQQQQQPQDKEQAKQQPKLQKQQEQLRRQSQQVAAAAAGAAAVAAPLLARLALKDVRTALSTLLYSDGRGRRLFSINESELVKPLGEEANVVWLLAADAAAGLARALREAGGVVREGLRVELQVTEVELGNVHKLVPPVKEAGEAKGAGKKHAGRKGR